MINCCNLCLDRTEATGALIDFHLTLLWIDIGTTNGEKPVLERFLLQVPIAQQNVLWDVSDKSVYV